MLKVLLVILSLTPVFAYGQKNKRALIYWSRERKLQWSDFRYREPLSIYSTGASTAISISIDPFEEDHLPNYRVTFRFNRSLSWTNDSTSIQLLRHEQYHFDIYELYARKIRAKILELRESGVEEKATYSKEITRLLSESKLFQLKYDEETAHGFLRTQQESWEVYIDHLLKEQQELSTDRYSIATADLSKEP